MWYLLRVCSGHSWSHCSKSKTEMSACGAQRLNRHVRSPCGGAAPESLPVLSKSLIPQTLNFLSCEVGGRARPFSELGALKHHDPLLQAQQPHRSWDSLDDSINQTWKPQQDTRTSATGHFCWSQQGSLLNKTFD